MMPAGPRPGDLGEMAIHGRDRPARKGEPMHHLESAARSSACAPLARWLGGSSTVC
jgi:hypothetical protein